MSTTIEEKEGVKDSKQKTASSLTPLSSLINSIKKNKIHSELETKQKLLQLSEITLILDGYKDIFSDFDPRGYEKRRLSDDFLFELKRAVKSSEQKQIELNLLVPLEQRKEETEAKIRKKLREYFKKQFIETNKEVNKIKFKGATMILFGLGLSILTVLFVIPFEEQHVFLQILSVLIEPAAWFSIWEGANKVFEVWKSLLPELEFLKKMSKCEVKFTSY